MFRDQINFQKNSSGSETENVVRKEGLDVERPVRS